MPYFLLTKVLWLVVSLVFALSVLMAQYTGDGHWVNRGGAVIAAIAAGSIVLQIMIEMGLEERQRALDAENELSPPVSARPSPIERLSLILSKKAMAEQSLGLKRQRLRVAFRVVVAAIVGELLHGLGDVFVCGFITCLPHE